MKKERGNSLDIRKGFEELIGDKRILRAVEDMEFKAPTEIQEKAIPLINSGNDIIGRSQTGTGKTMAFAIPAVERVLKDGSMGAAVLVMLPTRELALQCSEEFHRLTKFTDGIRITEVYGGVPMDRQITKLKRANIVVGTPGRIMDHLRRRTLKLDEIKLVVLDEADEMLSMGFKEDMETILRETPDNRQTVMFSATMPEPILAITEEFQHDPQVVEVQNKKLTLDNIEQTYVDVPMGRKTDALKLLLHYYKPSLTMIFCNTKRMADELNNELCKSGFDCEALHGDLNQSQRTNVMERFKNGSSSVLVATDVAARGIDVNDVELVVNYDIPQNNEYYVHRIGRTGRIGKQGKSITICSGRRQVYALLDIAKSVKSDVRETSVPTTDDIKMRINDSNAKKIEKAVLDGVAPAYTDMVNLLLSKGCSLFDIAGAALQMCFGAEEIKIADIKSERKQHGTKNSRDYAKIVLDIGRQSRVAPNHIVASITERSTLHGSDIGKIEIYDDKTVVSVPSENAHEVVDMMYGGKICGKPVHTSLFHEGSFMRSHQGSRDKHKSKGSDRKKQSYKTKGYAKKTAHRRRG